VGVQTGLGQAPVDRGDFHRRLLHGCQRGWLSVVEDRLDILGG
jgi:hypothetical protein